MEVVKLLVEAGADVNTANKLGGTALNRAAENGNVEMMNYLFDNGAVIGPLALIVASREGQLEAVKLLVRKGADVNAVQTWGQSALMQAAREGNIAIVQFLVRHGANIKLRDRNGNSALSLANENEHMEVGMYLRRAGATEDAVKKKPAPAPVDDDDDDDDSFDDTEIEEADEPVDDEDIDK